METDVLIDNLFRRSQTDQRLKNVKEIVAYKEKIKF